MPTCSAHPGHLPAARPGLRPTHQKARLCETPTTALQHVARGLLDTLMAVTGTRPRLLLSKARLFAWTEA